MCVLVKNLGQFRNGQVTLSVMKPTSHKPWAFEAKMARTAILRSDIFLLVFSVLKTWQDWEVRLWILPEHVAMQGEPLNKCYTFIALGATI